MTREMNERSHSILHNLQTSNPCPVKFDGMDGEERRRICSECKLTIYDIRELDEAEATKLIAAGEGYKFYSTRLFRRKDGTVTTANCATAGLIAWLDENMVGNAGTYVATLLIVGALLMLGGAWLRRALAPPAETQSFSMVVSQLNALNAYAVEQSRIDTSRTSTYKFRSGPRRSGR
jgi:hypothetical protein